ncbi:hypothetical protein SAMN05421780_10168 [Flexibacter flexilis DSM 6793]|uniref:Uncharacterized protein n=1 Tax=Flexibacter flexilis DSM 6793 TaxID=927664 RepID=A0A1I1D9L4_9BACT|nr:hypothetical protein SAMN05421780_10168 [Flexibacter flexilis DSM 6793]
MQNHPYPKFSALVGYFRFKQISTNTRRFSKPKRVTSLPTKVFHRTTCYSDLPSKVVFLSTEFFFFVLLCSLDDVPLKFAVCDI